MNKQQLQKKQSIVMLVAVGACVANIYFNQPILAKVLVLQVGIISVTAFIDAPPF